MRLVWALCSLTALLPGSPAFAQDAAGRLTREPYTLSTFDGQHHDAELGSLTVRENRANASSPVIKLAFLRVPSTSQKPLAPIVFLMGGPGIPGTVIARVPDYYRLFEKLREIADVIIPDQRGIGLSSPNLDCPDKSAFPPDAWESRDKVVHAAAARVAACATLFRRRGVDPAAYTTPASADDLNDLRAALKTPRLSLLAFSYGTELALDFLRRYPEQTERVVLQGLRAPEHGMLPSDQDMWIEQFSRLVARDPAVGREIPDMAGDLRRVLIQAECAPFKVDTPGKDGGPAVVTAGKFGLQSYLDSTLGDVTAPALLHATANGDRSLLDLAVRNASDSVSFSLMAVAVNCASRWSETRMTLVRREAPGAMLGDAKHMMTSTEICREVGDPDAGTAFRAPIRSDVCTLFINGTLDPNMLIWQVEEVRSRFSNSAIVWLENGGHELLAGVEVQKLVVQFFGGENIRSQYLHDAAPKFISVADAKTRALRQK